MAYFHNQTQKIVDRIHNSQMDKSTKQAIREKTASVLAKPLSFSPHAAEKMSERNISATDVLFCLKSPYSVIEFKDVENKHQEYRVLLRCHSEIKGLNYCIVVSLTLGRIVTVYANANSDNHTSINMAAYNPKLNVSSCLRHLN